MTPVVVKLGGRALESAGALEELADDLRALAGQVVLVHGGGPEVSAWSTRLGLEPRFHEGRRVTDEATLEVATAVLAGLANKRLVAALLAHGVDAVGLAALDGGTVQAVPHPEQKSLGAVGTVAEVRPGLIASLLSQGRVPVVASIGAHDGGLLNLNADDVATALARGLGARALVLLSDAPGLRLGGRIVSRLDPDAADQARKSPEVKDGMGPKLEAASSAARGGVSRAWIAAWSGRGTLASLLAGDGTPKGTCVTLESQPEESPHGR